MHPSCVHVPTHSHQCSCTPPCVGSSEVSEWQRQRPAQAEKSPISAAQQRMATSHSSQQVFNAEINGGLALLSSPLLAENERQAGAALKVTFGKGWQSSFP